MPIKDSLSYVDWAAAMAFFVEDAQQSMDRTSHVKERRSEQSQRGKLSEIIRSKFVDAQWVAMNGTKYLIINALVVDRSNQSCDVFSGLLSYATEYADQEGMSMCAQIPQSEAAMFERAGFQQFSSFELDLEHYTQSNSKQSFETLVSQVFIFLVRRARHRLT